MECILPPQLHLSQAHETLVGMLCHQPAIADSGLVAFTGMIIDLANESRLTRCSGSENSSMVGSLAVNEGSR